MQDRKKCFMELGVFWERESLLFSLLSSWFFKKTGQNLFASASYSIFFSFPKPTQKWKICGEHAHINCQTGIMPVFSIKLILLSHIIHERLCMICSIASNDPMVHKMTCMHKSPYHLKWHDSYCLQPPPHFWEGFSHRSAKQRVMIQFDRGRAWTYFSLIA